MDILSQISKQPDSIYHRMPGYEGMLAVHEGPGGLCHPPVLSDQYPQPETEPSYSNWDFPTPSKEDARRALIKYVSEQSYDSTKPAEQCVITNMEAFDIYKYSLETYMEKRTTVWSRVPYIGQKIDMSEQTPPLPWEIPANAPTLFQNVEQAIQVPHTTSVQDCYRCKTGIITCTPCHGTGSIRCSICHGNGYSIYSPELRNCIFCGGLGYERCRDCNALGSKKCEVCSGHRRILLSIKLIVNWISSVDQDFVKQSSGLQKFKLPMASGSTVFTQSNTMGYPIRSFPNPEVTQISEKLLRKHREKFSSTSRILQQRQSIHVIPVTKVTYTWKEESHVFHLYGTDFKVSADDYPATGCSCCPLM